MRYSPSSIEVPYGDRLVIELINLDEGTPHDLSFGDDLTTRRIMPGERATLDVGVVGSSGQGWCTIVGHRQMGMVLDVEVRGGRTGHDLRRRGRSLRRRRRGGGERRGGGARHRLGQPAPAASGPSTRRCRR